MAQDFFSVGIVVAKRSLNNRWASHVWLPIAVLPAVPETPPWTRLGGTDTEETFYAGALEVELNAAATGHYRDNLAAAQPSLWLALRPVGDDVEITMITADPYEGEALVESIGDTIEAVPMPLDIQRRVQAFVDTFHVERTFFKRKRDRADPEALGRRVPGARKDGEYE